ncbi:putative knottin, scorpion toxin [Medicago truncatula]|uniref:Defensin-like protein n=1 Tax=Medicago truncatula TaxID=3880 RepID=A0A072UDF3_MEDTR|nr:Defensin-like protein [Medicago truncatula]RHN48139.1 putative knottin, scorpion toxin [Medicago truncatula]
MTSFISKFYPVFMFLCLVIFLIFSWPWEVEEKVCGRPNRTWSGPCIDSDCDEACLDLEFAAIYGSCGGTSYDCFCFFKC